MPDGQLLYTNGGLIPEGNVNTVLNGLFLLLDHASANDAGVFIQQAPFSHGALEIVNNTGTGTFSLQLYGSNQQAEANISGDGTALGAAITTAGVTVINYPVRWLKAKLTVSGGAQITAIYNAYAP